MDNQIISMAYIIKYRLYYYNSMIYKYTTAGLGPFSFYEKVLLLENTLVHSHILYHVCHYGRMASIPRKN